MLADTSIRYTHKNPKISVIYLQEHLNILSPYYEKWKMKINESKSKFILFTRKRISPVIQQNQIKQSSSIKYLVVTIEHKLKFNHYCKNVLQQARQTLVKIYVLLGYYSNLHKTNKMKIYKTCVRSLLTYNIHVWDDVSNSNLKK